jgi:acyl carrier protein
VVRARLAEHKVPHRIVLVDALPRNPSGKVVKDDVRAMVTVAQPAGEGAARTASEATVAAIWEGVLGVASVGVDDDFFAVGGHSLAAAQIAARMRDAFDVDVPVVAVFERPTVAELAALVDEAASPTPAG